MTANHMRTVLALAATVIHSEETARLRQDDLPHENRRRPELPDPRPVDPATEAMREKRRQRKQAMWAKMHPGST